MTGNKVIYNYNYSSRSPTSTKTFSCFNPYSRVKKDICMITSEIHILVILQMFTMCNLNICVKCKIFLDDGVENTVSEWCQKKCVTLWKFKFLMYFNLLWVSFQRYWLRLYWKQTEALLSVLSDTFCHNSQVLTFEIWPRNWILNFI